MTKICVSQLEVLGEMTEVQEGKWEHGVTDHHDGVVPAENGTQLEKKSTVLVRLV